MASRRGLALAAGGGRGAYQAGALLALAENDIEFDAVAGSSIGALNGAFYAQGDGAVQHMRTLCDLWRSLPSAGIIRLDGAAAASAVAQVVAFGPVRATVQSLIRRKSVAILDPRPVAAMLDAWLDYETICQSSQECVFTVLPMIHPLIDIVTAVWREVTCLTASDLGPQELRQGLLAACAIPLAFPAQELQGRRSNDAALADPLPAGELHRRGVHDITSIFLSDDTIQNRADFPGTTLFQIRPSAGIGTGLRSVFDFSQESIERLIRLGHDDTIAMLAEKKVVKQAILDLDRQGTINVTMADALPPDSVNR